MAAGNSAGFALPASAPVRGGGRGSWAFRRAPEARDGGGFSRSLEPKALPFGTRSIAHLRAALTRGKAQQVGADPETASRDATDTRAQTHTVRHALLLLAAHCCGNQGHGFFLKIR